MCGGMALSGQSPPVEEVVAALGQFALLALILASVVVIVRVLQVSADKQQAARARMEAIEYTRQRLKTLADRRKIYGGYAAFAFDGEPSEAPEEDAPVAPSSNCVYANGNGKTFYDLQDHIPAFGSSSSHESACTGAARPSNETGPEPAGGGDGICGGGPSILAASAAALWHRRHTSSSLCAAASSDCNSGYSSGASLRSTSTAAECKGVPDDGGRGAVARSRSYCDNDGVVWFVAPNTGGGAGGAATGECGTALLAAGGGGARKRSALQHKMSDSLVETSALTREVLGSVPPETVTSTRQVLASFNYDYSALHRREAKYVQSALGRGDSTRRGC